MTTQDIYTLANETTENQFNNLLNGFNKEEEKVQNLTKYHNVNDVVTIEFNVNCNEYQGKYYTTLSAWKIAKKSSNTQSNQEPFAPATNLNEEEHNDLPF